MKRREFLSGAVSLPFVGWLNAAVPMPVGTSGENRFGKLPAGACRAHGWLQRQMDEDAHGWVWITNQMSQEGIWIQCEEGSDRTKAPSYYPYEGYFQAGTKTPFYYPYVERKGAPVGGEYQAHWLDAVFRLGWVGGLEDYRKLGTKAVNDILSSLDSDGYIGVFPASERVRPNGKDVYAVYELWGDGEALNALLLYHRFTGDERVLAACRKGADWLIDRTGPSAPGASQFLGTQAWYSNIANAMVYLYRHSGDQKHLSMAEFMFQSWVKRRFGGDWGVILGEPMPHAPLRGHTAGWGITLLSGLEVYRATGDAALLRGMRTANDIIVQQDLQPHGAPSGEGEALAGTGPYLNTELCDVFWWSWWWTEMAALTGESQFADLAEAAVFNALPGHRSKDGTVTAYFTCPNQLIAARRCRSHYAARRYVECCQSNAPRTLPIFVEYMVLVTPDDGLAVAYYGPSETRVRRKSGGEVRVIQETTYPFEEEIRVAVQASPAARFPLLLRIPAWCQGAQIRINGEAMPSELKSGGWARLERKWGANDRVVVRLPMSVRVDFWNQQAVSVRRGPLLYSLPVQGDRSLYDKWGSFEEFASPGAAWNYALVLNEKDPGSSFQFVKQEVPAGARVWEHSPVALEVQGVRVPDWTFVDDGKSKLNMWNLNDEGKNLNGPRLPERPFSVARTTERLRLVPYGFTTLRMTYLPHVTSTAAVWFAPRQRNAGKGPLRRREVQRTISVRLAINGDPGI